MTNHLHSEAINDPVVSEVAGKLPLKQNPHAVRGDGERKLEVAIGLEVRMLRKQLGITVSDLAESSGLSLGMLSKIENGLTSPSLTTLQSLSHALGVPISHLLRRFEEERVAVQVKSGEGVSMERRGTRAGHQYQLLGYLGANESGVVGEPYMITLNDNSDVFPTFQHDGIEYLYFLEGRVEYRHGDQTFLMEPGDSLYFDADAPHGPVKLIELPARYLSVITYPQSSQKSPKTSENL
jgi:transcriptional regulator with XRE-family HTH domain